MTTTVTFTAHAHVHMCVHVHVVPSLTLTFSERIRLQLLKKKEKYHWVPISYQECTLNELWEYWNRIATAAWPNLEQTATEQWMYQPPSYHTVPYCDRNVPAECSGGCANSTKLYRTGLRTCSWQERQYPVYSVEYHEQNVSIPVHRFKINPLHIHNINVAIFHYMYSTA